MKPPICHLCGRDFVDEVLTGRTDGGEFVRFKDYQPLDDDAAGHPQGAEWFCIKHRDAARKLSGLAIEEAMKKLRRKYFFRWW